jgi:IS66 Orf2 like protein
MFGLSAAVRVYLATKPADMRKNFDGLFALASGLALDPLSGHLFVFVNKRRDRIKVLYWDRDGLAVWAKTQTTDYPRTHWWNTPTAVGHNRPGGAAPTRGVVPTTTSDCAPRRITMLGRPRPTAPPRPERPADDR